MKKSILATLMVSALAASYATAANQDSAATKKRVAAVEKEYNVARAKCNRMTSTDKDTCIADARKWHATAIADARSYRAGATAMGSTATAQTASGSGTPVTKAEALRECEKMSGDQKTACVLERPAAKGTTAQSASKAADKTQAVVGRALDKTQEAAGDVVTRTDNAIDRTAVRSENAAARAGNATERAIDKTKATASNVAERTGDATERAVDKTKAAAATVADKTERASDKAGDVVADSVITTRVKTDLFKEPDLKALAIHVETEKGVVMLSGFVNSKDEASRAVNVAKGVKGVSEVKSALKVK